MSVIIKYDYIVQNSNFGLYHSKNFGEETINEFK